jgi:hypothetical protein
MLKGRVATLQPLQSRPKDLFLCFFQAQYERDMSCVVVWGHGGEREGELKLFKRGGEPSSPAFKVNPGEEDGTPYHHNNVVLFFFNNNKNEVVSHKTYRFI